MEKRDLYDEKRHLTGETIYKGEEIPNGRYIIVVLVLIQKRSEIKNGKYATTGGHCKTGENSIQGILTEIKEEIGLDVKAEDLKLYYSGKAGFAFWDDYYIKMDVPNIEKLKLQKEEVESVCWLTEEEIKQLMNEDKFFKNHYEEFEILLEWLKNRK